MSFSQKQNAFIGLENCFHEAQPRSLTCQIPRPKPPTARWSHWQTTAATTARRRPLVSPAVAEYTVANNQHDSTLPLCRAQKESCGAQSGIRGQGVSPASPARAFRVDVDTCWFRKSCRLLLLPCPSVLSVVVMCLHVLRQFHRLHSEWGQMTNATAINAVTVLEEVCADTNRSGACGSICLNTGKLTRF